MPSPSHREATARRGDKPSRGPGGLSDDPVKRQRQLDALADNNARQLREREEAAADPRPLTFAYLDPPYPGESKRLYEWHDDFEGEVDHVALVGEYLERWRAGELAGFALSTKESALIDLLPLFPEGHRVGAWIKPMTPFKPWPDVQYGWEPVIWVGGRRRSRKAMVVNNYVVANPVNWKTMPGGVPGMKPVEFSFWLFEVLNMRDGDTFLDVFPGSGAVGRAWESYRAQMKLAYNGRLKNTELEGFPA